MRHAKTIGVSLILLGTFLWVAPAHPQDDQQPSVAEAARKARAQKKASEKPVAVVTNDTLEPPKLKPEVTSATATEATLPGGTASTQESPASGSATTSETKPATASEAADEEKDAEAKKALEALKQEIRELKKEVDLQQRAVSLANEDFYSKPDFSKDTNGKAKLEAMMNELLQKKDELTQLLAKLPAGESADEPKPEQPQQR